MQSKYIREEIIVERTAREENKAVWEKETAILAALNEYYNSLNASIDDATVEAAMAGELSRDYISGEMLKTGGGPQSCFALCSKVHWSIYYHRECMRAETSADALRELAAQDTTHCLTLRVIVQDSDPNLTPEIYVKAKDDTAIRNGDALWQPAVQSDDTWTGYVPLSGYLPNCTAVPQPIIDACKAKAEEGIWGYTSRPSSYFEAVQEWEVKRNNWKPDTALMSWSLGVVPALSAIVKLFSKDGDKVLIQTPVYSEFYDVVEAWDRTVVENKLVEENGTWHVDFDDFAAKVKECSIFLLCNPHNPLGLVWDPADLKKWRSCASRMAPCWFPMKSTPISSSTASTTPPRQPSPRKSRGASSPACPPPRPLTWPACRQAPPSSPMRK